MCDLSAGEREAIMAHVKELDDLLSSIKTSTQSIQDRNWMDHDELSQLLGRVTETANQAQSWVHQKVASHG
jgi:hypothetical protein